jgi:hypothetical protein
MLGRRCSRSYALSASILVGASRIYPVRSHDQSPDLNGAKLRSVWDCFPQAAERIDPCSIVGENATLGGPSYQPAEAPPLESRQFVVGFDEPMGSFNTHDDYCGWNHGLITLEMRRLQLVDIPDVRVSWTLRARYQWGIRHHASCDPSRRSALG